jgi:glycosyltransferase involved in cell wall biosynthesis
VNPVKISVLLPFCNPGSFFRDAVESVLLQLAPSFELILVNNNSDTGSLNYAESVAASDSRVKLIQETNQGIAFALNKGLRHCTGTYIARMDADDVCLPDRLQKQSDYLDRHPDTGMVSGLVRFIGDSETGQGMQHYVAQINSLISADDLYHHRFVESPFAHPSVMFRKSLIDQFGDYSTEKVPEDYELWLRWFSCGVRMEKIPVEVISWRDHPERASRNQISYSSESFDRVRLSYLVAELRKHPGNKMPLYIWGGGRLSRKKASILSGFGLQIDGYIDVYKERKINNSTVIHFSEIPAAGQIYIVSLVSNRGRYREIGQYLQQKGYQQGRDFLLAG